MMPVRLATFRHTGHFSALIDRVSWTKPHSLGTVSIYQPDSPVDEFLGEHVAQRRAMYVLAGPLFITGFAYVGQSAPGNCHAQSTPFTALAAA